ncbi:uncharacterized protein LOC110821586 isoform X2 [Carica papaya]|uniref:uncharacterized protein LOC110821586 isoform X2 n=1 Tax=Carica papaya TaxID=3649 RepID=UPI000B8CE0BD|nr:uncharacterized protein LOC110821586 isoform X2 [Carica papaya]
MGGDTVTNLSFSHDEEFLPDQDFSEISSIVSVLTARDDLKIKGENRAIIGDDYDALVSGKPDELSLQRRASPLQSEAEQRRIRNLYEKILQSYEMQSSSLSEAKSKILSYTPGKWIEKVGGMKLSNYEVPNTTTLILIGPRGSGKSSLINRISKVFEDDKFASERAQVSYNSSVTEGTYFLHEYVIPRYSGSFCLYDTRGLDNCFSDNIDMIKRWMTKGVRHGEPVIWASDSQTFKERLKCKARGHHCQSSDIRMVNFVIFVINGLEVLKSMESANGAEMSYTQMISSAFHTPYLSFKDDKPAVILTHGDLLSLADRSHIRVYLGELLGIPPIEQIFDIPESYDPITELTIVDMLRYSLERADRNLPGRIWAMHKISRSCLSASFYLVIILGILVAACCIQHAHKRMIPKPEPHIDWHAIRHLWSD